MLKVGLTGGIGCGKTAVAGMFARLGARVIDADELARQELAAGTRAFKETVRVFGEGILLPDGAIDRAALADIVFSDPARRRKLEDIVHPGVFEREAALTEMIAKEDPDAVVVFDAALLVESGAHERMDRVVVVWCPSATQLERVMKKTGLKKDDALRRIAAQMPVDEKKAYATDVIDNGGELSETEEQVGRLYRQFKQYV